MCLPRIRLSASERASVPLWLRRTSRRRLEAGSRQLCSQVVARGEPGPVGLLHRGEVLVQPEPAEVRGVEGGDREPPVRSEHAVELRECTRPVDQVDDEPHDRPLEPGVLEGQLLGRAELQPGAVSAAARDLEHLRRGVDPPDLGPAGERGQEPTRATANLEDATAGEVALADQRLADLAPVPVGGTELVVGCGATPEVRRRR